MEDIRGADEAEEEEDLVEVVDMSFSIIVEHQGITHESVQVRHTRLLSIALSLNEV